MAEREGASQDLPILYRDERLVAIDKPPGILVHRSREAADTVAVLQLLRDQIGTRVYPIHRLDRAASGVLLFALDSEAAAAAQRSLAEDETEKIYITMVRGSTAATFASQRPLHSDAGRLREAHTAFHRLAEMSRCSLLQARLHTGRRHQIRRHLAHLAHQVLGDTRYGKGRINRYLRETYGLPRLFLHARRLRLSHPLSGNPLEINAPLAPDLCGFLARLPDVPHDLLELQSDPLPSPTRIN